jgi:hypothetical protein
MDNGYPPEAWKRLGKRLTDRRVELGYPFRKRKSFWEDRGDPSLLSLKTVERIERAERPDYTDETLAVVERLYGYEPGSVEAILRDEEPTIAAAASPAPGHRRSHLAEVPPGGLDDELIQQMAQRIIATAGENRAIMEAVWAGTHVPAKVRLEIMLDYPRYDPRDPVDFDSDDGDADARDA